MVLSLFAGVGIHFATKAASTKTMIPFDPDNGYTYRVQNDNEYVEGGTYYYEYDNRVYTYNLTENLPAGTVMTFNQNNKNITWETNHNYGRTDIESVSGVTVDEDNTDDTHATLNIAKTANLSKDTDYYYDLDNGSIYAFRLTDDFVGRVTQTVRGTANTETQYTEGTLVLDFENENADITGTRYESHYLYIEDDAGLTSNGVYLIGARTYDGSTEENIVAYNNASSTNVTQSGYETNESILGWDENDVVAYAFNTNSRFYNTYPLAGEAFTDNKPYYDGGAIRTSNANGRSQYLLGEFTAVGSSSPSGYYLKAVNINSSNYTYLDNTALGHVYTTADPQNLYVHEYSTQRSRIRNGGSWINPNYETQYNHYGSIWNFTSHQLISENSSRNPTNLSQTSPYKYLSFNSGNGTQYRLTQTSGDYVTLYKRTFSYIPEAYTNTGSGTVYTDSPGAVAPTNVSYTENYTVEDNYLELDKTVTPVGNDTYKVHLEAYTTEPKIKQPKTDVVMVMDTSKKMDSELYSRNYKNLNTYTKFKAVSLSDRIHDDLFDGEMNDEDRGLIMQLINALGSSASSTVFDNRNYISNRYVEDPNSPGTYVYLYQKYRQEGSIAGQLAYILTFGLTGSPMMNYYTYYFTSSNGEEYSTTEISEQMTDTAGYLISRNGTINSLTFYKNGDLTNSPYPVSTIYQRDGENKDKALNRTSDNLSNTGLYEISLSGGGLFIRDNDGEYKPVTITPVNKNLQQTTPASAVLYKYSVAGTDYVMYQGASQGGVQDSVHHPEYYGVYQGFRYYIEDPDNPGKLIIDEDRSLLSKSLYTLATSDEDRKVTRLQALKEASEEFLLNVYKQSQAADINVGIVTYDAGATTLYQLGKLKDGSPADLSNANHIDQMISDIYNLRANTDSNASTIDDGMANGKTEFDERSPDGNRRFLLLFSGGVPADYTTFWFITTFDTSSGDYDTSVATNAIRTAYDLKNNMNTTIYSVGLFENADEAESSTYGHKYYYGLHPATNCNNEIGNSWGRTGLANYIITNWTDLSIDPMDAAATNRMLGYISSDYATPQTIGLTRYAGGLGFWNRTNPGLDYYGNWYYIFSTGGPGYKISNRYSKTDSNHYFGISPATVNEEGGDGEEGSDVTVIGTDPAVIIERFKTVFDTLIAETSVPSNILTEDAKLLDGITEYFTLKPETVEAYTQSSTDGGATWSSAHDSSLVTCTAYPDTEAAITEDTKTLVATLHDYHQYYVQPGREGKKLVLEFEIERIPDLIGGNNIPTNLNNSGIYDGNPLHNPVLGTLGVLEEKFEVPKVDLDIIDIETIAQPQSAYYGCEADLEDMVNPYWVNGKNNEFVNMEYTFYDPDGHEVSTYTVPAGYAEGTWSPEVDSEQNTHARFVQMLETSDYEVHLRVIPSTSGTVNERNDFDPGVGRVYVFTPHYDVHNDEVEEAGDNYNVLSDIPELGDWELDLSNLDTENMTAEELADMRSEAHDLLAFKQEPGVNYELTNVTTNTAVANKDVGYPIPTRTVFQMRDVMVTPTPVPYLAKNVVVGRTLYTGSGDNRRLVGVQTLDSEGNVASTVWYDSDGNVTETAQSYSSSEDIRGDITKYANRAQVNATPKTSFNNTDDHNTIGQFTINLKSHDVTIVNHTTGEPGSDYSDPTKEFPLTFTLKDGNTPVANETITYIDAAGQTQTATTNSSGQIVINMKDSDTVTLKEIRDGYKLTVTSTPPPGDLYELYAQAGPDADHLSEVDVDVDTETTDEILIGDETLIDLIHHIGDIPVTLLGDADAKLNPFFLAAALIALLGGSGTAYVVKRKKDGEG